MRTMDRPMCGRRPPGGFAQPRRTRPRPLHQHMNRAGTCEPCSLDIRGHQPRIVPVPACRAPAPGWPGTPGRPLGTGPKPRRASDGRARACASRGPGARRPHRPRHVPPPVTAPASCQVAPAVRACLPPQTWISSIRPKPARTRKSPSRVTTGSRLARVSARAKGGSGANAPSCSLLGGPRAVDLRRKVKLVDVDRHLGVDRRRRCEVER